ncbi:MAG TPA: carboxypeptidase-like regulatory domain-containing protein, partial [Vicinamibacterales bacterium]
MRAGMLRQQVSVLILSASVCASGAAKRLDIPGAAPLQTPALPRDNAKPVATSTFRGRVVASDTGSPLRRAQVRASAPELRESRVTTTDGQGRYELKDLPAGRYTLTASKMAYVTLQFGQQRAFEPGKPIQIGAGEVLERIDFSLPRGAVLAG